ncbi:MULTISPECIES: hypothetical protein [unclassified Mesorhizobium]|uniref:hypothetical protein n=1 Tax=unclassified Mesorhizobium TaxID=325217 RepID=UPI00333B76CC
MSGAAELAHVLTHQPEVKPRSRMPTAGDSAFEEALRFGRRTALPGKAPEARRCLLGFRIPLQDKCPAFARGRGVACLIKGTCSLDEDFRLQ